MLRKSQSNPTFFSGSEDVVFFPPMELRKISYSAVFLDDESQQKIMDFCRRHLSGHFFEMPEAEERYLLNQGFA